MSLKSDLEDKVGKILADTWSAREGISVPSAEDLKLTNDAVNLDGVVLYADMSNSTDLVDQYKAEFAAEIYKSYLHCAAKVIRSHGGEITAYDGDRIMAVFIGDYKNTSATKSALKINWARKKIINPSIQKYYKTTKYSIKHTIGIDSSKLFVARTGIRGSNDLVWVGRSANHAAKLCSLSSNFPTRITAEVYNLLDDSAKFSNGKNMWEKVTWNTMNRTIYRSKWIWSI